MPQNKFSIVAIACAAATAVAGGVSLAAPPKNVILFIGDGLGAEQIRAAGYYFNGAAGQFSFEQFDHFAWMTTNNSSGGVTDSAASATAMATGFKVNNDVVSIARASGPDPRSATPSDDRDLETILEKFKAQGKRTGMVTNGFLNDATPGAFAAHVPDRGATNGISSDYFNQSRPNVLFGGSALGLTPTIAQNRGYTVVSNRAEMQALDTTTVSQVISFFGTTQFDFAYDQSVGSTSFYGTNPYLEEMTQTALDILNRDNNGFFLMVENDLIDSAGHLPVTGADKAQRAIFEVRELSRAVQRAIDFAANNPDTLILVTSDHEAGGFTSGPSLGQGVFPQLISGDTRHNATWIPLYAQGPNAGHVLGILDNTDVPRIAMTPAAEPSLPPVQVKHFRQGVEGYTSAADTQVRADTPLSTHASAALLMVDQDDDPGNLSTPAAPVQSVLRFGDLFSQQDIPAEATIVSAKLSLYTGNSSDDGTSNNLSVHRLLVGFDDDTSWANAGGVSENGFSLNSPGTEDDDYSAVAESRFPAPTQNAIATFDVTLSVSAWLESFRAGADTNLGWVILNDGTNSWVFHSSEAASELSRPTLEVTYVVPEPSAVAMFGVLATMLASRRRLRA